MFINIQLSQSAEINLKFALLWQRIAEFIIQSMNSLNHQNIVFIQLQKITFNAPTVPVVNNVDVKCETNGDAIRDALVRQLYNPVQWTKSVEYMAAQGVEHLYEVGPGKVLTGLTKRIVDTLTASALNEPSAMAAALEL